MQAGGRKPGEANRRQTVGFKAGCANAYGLIRRAGRILGPLRTVSMWSAMTAMFTRAGWATGGCWEYGKGREEGTWVGPVLYRPPIDQQLRSGASAGMGRWCLVFVGIATPLCIARWGFGHVALEGEMRRHRFQIDSIMSPRRRTMTASTHTRMITKPSFVQIRMS